MKITNEEQLRDLSFKRYNRTVFDSESVKYRYQKRYDDELGKRYFIDCKVWDWSWTNRIPEDYNFEFETQLYQAGTHDTIDISFHTTDIDEIEKFINKLFDADIIEHYELWD